MTRTTGRSSRRSQVLSTFLAVLLIGVLFRYWAVVEIFFRSLAASWSETPSGSALITTLVVGGFLGLLAASVVGLFRRRKWGVYCAYALVPVSTMLHSIPLVPFVSDLLPNLQLRIAAVFVLNLIFLAATILLHVEYRRTAIRTEQLEGAT